MNPFNYEMGKRFPSTVMAAALRVKGCVAPGTRSGTPACRAVPARGATAPTLSPGYLIAGAKLDGGLAGTRVLGRR